MSDKFDSIFESTMGAATKNDKQEEFFERRASGAKKIQKAAQAKGGPSILTAYHFRAKEKPYKECLARLNDPSYAEAHADNCLDQLKDWKKMTQKEFQEVMGRLEVYGEVFIQTAEKS